MIFVSHLDVFTNFSAQVRNAIVAVPYMEMLRELLPFPRLRLRIFSIGRMGFFKSSFDMFGDPDERLAASAYETIVVCLLNLI